MNLVKFRLKQSLSSLFLSPQLYLLAVRLLCSYQYKTPSRRFVYDLFDKFNWDNVSLQFLNKAHGVCLTTRIVFQTNDWKDASEALDMELIEENVQSFSHSFVSAKITKGFKQ